MPIPEYFKPWRRKIGVFVLLLACLFTAAWFRSLETINRLKMKTAQLQFNWVTSMNGGIVWQRVVPVDESNWSKDINENGPTVFGEFAEALAEYYSGFTSGGNFEKHRFLGVQMSEYQNQTAMGPIKLKIWRLSYWRIIVPLTLLSAYLLLSKPRLKSTTLQS